MIIELVSVDAGPADWEEESVEVCTVSEVETDDSVVLCALVLSTVEVAL